MTRDLAAEFDALGPWVTKFQIDGKGFGGDYDAASDSRVVQFHAAFPDVTSVLELGSFEGGHTASVAQLPGIQRVVALEGRPENVARAEFALDLLGVRNVDVRVVDLETFDLSTLGSFDVVFNCGLLYHLPRPWELLERIAAVANRMYLSTHYAADESVDTNQHGYPGYWYQEFGYADRLSGLAPSSFWPTRAALIEMLAASGFSHSDVVFDDPNFPHGPLVNLATWK
jgi:SAM-dependent methyltransferase